MDKKVVLEVYADVRHLAIRVGEKHHVAFAQGIAAIDRVLRLVFYLVYDGKTAENAADFLARCREYFSFEIRTVLTDNGKGFSNHPFKGRSGSTTDKVGLFDRACGEDTEHRLTKLGTLKTNGMVERASLTIKSATFHRQAYISRRELSTSLADFLLHYNLRRRHESLVRELNVRTPIDVCIKCLGIQPDLFSKNHLQFGNICVALQRECGQNNNNIIYQYNYQHKLNQQIALTFK